MTGHERDLGPTNTKKFYLYKLLYFSLINDTFKPLQDQCTLAVPVLRAKSFLEGYGNSCIREVNRWEDFAGRFLSSTELE